MITAGNTKHKKLPIKWMIVAVLCFISGYDLCAITGGKGLVVDGLQDATLQASGEQALIDGFQDDETRLLYGITKHMRSTNTSVLAKSLLSLLSESSRTLSSGNAKRKDYSSWCPTAVCHNSNLCRPCDRRFLIIFTTGRSASTTLTYMLDSLPGVRMSGENKAMINQLQKMVDSIRYNFNFKQGTDKKHAWGHNRVPEGAFACVGQRMIETLNPPPFTNYTENGTPEEDDSDTIVGFKTIRLYEDVDPSNDQMLADFVKETFPCARFVVNIQSDSIRQVKSQNLAFGGEHSREDVIAMNRRMRNLAKLFGADYARLTDTSQWTRDLKDVNDVVKWLGFSEACFFNSTLGFHTRFNGHRKVIHPPECKYLG